mgnify:CR=1 FL=1
MTLDHLINDYSTPFKIVVKGVDFEHKQIVNNFENIRKHAKNKQ